MIDFEMTNYCFADVNVFTKYEKFEIPLVEKTVEKRTNFSIAEQGTVRMTIEVENGKKIDLTLQDILHTSELCPDLILILKIYMSLNMIFSTNNVVVRLDDRYIVI